MMRPGGIGRASPVGATLMVTFLKGLRRPEPQAPTAVASARAERPSTAREYAALEALVVRAEAAAQQLRSLSAITETAEALEAMQERFAAVESRLAGVEQLGARMAS